MQCKWHPIFIRSQINKGLGLGLPDAPTQHEIPDPCSLQQLLAPTPFYRKGLESLCLCEFTGHFLACNRRDGLEGMDYKVDFVVIWIVYVVFMYVCFVLSFSLFFGGGGHRSWTCLMFWYLWDLWSFWDMWHVWCMWWFCDICDAYKMILWHILFVWIEK